MCCYIIHCVTSQIKYNWMRINSHVFVIFKLTPVDYFCRFSQETSVCKSVELIGGKETNLRAEWLVCKDVDYHLTCPAVGAA